MKLKNRKLQDHLRDRKDSCWSPKTQLAPASPEHSAFAGMIRKRSSGPGRFFLGDCLLSISEILRWLNAFWVYCKVQNCNVPIFLCMYVCCTRSQNLGQQNSMASQLFPLKHSTKLYGVATLSFEALTPRKRTPQHRKNKYQNISKYPYANDWLDLTWSTLIRHVWLHWYMASYSMGHPSTTAPHKRSTVSNEAFKRLKVSLPFSKHARHWIPIPSDQTSPPGRMFINFPREF